MLDKQKPLHDEALEMLADIIRPSVGRYRANCIVYGCRIGGLDLASDLYAASRDLPEDQARDEFGDAINAASNLYIQTAHDRDAEQRQLLAQQVETFLRPLKH